MLKFFALVLFFLSFNLQADVVYTAETKGMLLKDKLIVASFQDPDYPVTCHYSTYQREGVFGSTLSSSVQINCVLTGKITTAITSKKNLFNKNSLANSPFTILSTKTLTLDRIADKNVLIYLLYTNGTGTDEGKQGASGDHGMTTIFVP